jgi:predicted ester cyclase
VRQCVDLATTRGPLIVALSCTSVWAQSLPKTPTGVEGLNTADSIFHGQGFRGLEEYCCDIGRAPDTFSNRVNDGDDILAKGNPIIVSWVFTARHANPAFGLPVTGNLVHIRETAMLRFRDGRVSQAAFRGADVALYFLNP